MEHKYLNIAREIVDQDANGVLVGLFERRYISNLTFLYLSIEEKSFSFDNTVLFPNALEAHLDGIAGIVKLIIEFDRGCHCHFKK